LTENKLSVNIFLLPRHEQTTRFSNVSIAAVDKRGEKMQNGLDTLTATEKLGYEVLEDEKGNLGPNAKATKHLAWWSAAGLSLLADNAPNHHLEALSGGNVWPS
jgi:hypothetical protein